MDRRVLLGGVAAGLLLAITAGLYATGMIGGSATSKDQTSSTNRAPKDDGEPTSKTSVVSSELQTEKKTGASEAKSEVEGKPAGFTVRNADGSVHSTEPDLKSAMQVAIGSKGHVWLDHREPIKLTGDDATIKIDGGPLYIRAAEGIEPVLEVEIKGAKPFLTTGIGSPLTMTGVTIIAHFDSSARLVPPVIESANRVVLDRCVFKATGKTEQARGFSIVGPSLSATGTWFDGFAQGLDIGAFSGSTVALKQCLFSLRPSAEDQQGGWALRVLNKPGGGSKTAKPTRRLSLDHCTVVGQGFMELIAFSSTLPYHVEVTGCAVHAGSLLAWAPKDGTSPPKAPALEWKGKENVYDIQGKEWAIRSSEGGVGLPDGPTNLDTWAKLVSEESPLSPPIQFRTKVASLSESPTPRDFLILQTDQPVGADPSVVGPKQAEAKSTR